MKTVNSATATKTMDKPIAVLLKTYPKLSETFILEEILGLERMGLALNIFSLQAPTDDISHPAVATVKAPVHYVGNVHWGNVHWQAFLTLLKAQLYCLFRWPLGYLNAVRFLLTRSESGRLQDFLQAAHLAQQLQQAGISHLYVHFINRPAAIAELVYRLSGVSYSISAHAKDIYLSTADVLSRKLQHARFVVTCTEYNYRYLRSIAPPSASISRLYHGVDLDRLQPASGDMPVSEPPLIISVGRLREKKGFPTLIEACALLQQAGTQFRCQIIGYGPEQQRLQQLIDSLGLNGTVELLGKLPHQTVIERYRQASLFALPCRIDSEGDRDGIPNVLLEAMAMELPVISTTVSGIPEVVQHRFNGLLVLPTDPSALAKAIQTVLAHPDLAKRLGKAGRFTVTKRFANATNLQQLRDLLLAVQNGTETTDLIPFTATAGEGCCD